MNNILFEVTPTTPSGVPVTIRLARSGSDVRATQVDGKEWLPFITSFPSYSMTFMDDDGNISQTNTSRGGMEFICSEAFGNIEWAGFVWGGALAKMWRGNVEDPFSEYEQIFEGSVSSHAKAGNNLSLELLGMDALLDEPFLSQSYKGTGGIEGPKEMEGTVKPWVSGFVRNMTPILIDHVNWIYQVHGYGAIQDVDKVYEHGIAFDPAKRKADAADYAALAALTLLPSEWAVCPSQGLFRIGGAPSKDVTADVKGAKDGANYPEFLSEIIPHLLKQAGIPVAKIGSFTHLNGIRWNTYETAEITAGDLIRGAAADAGAVFFSDGTGTFQSGMIFNSKVAEFMRDDRSTLPLVHPDSITMLPTAYPVHKVEIGYDRNWTVQSDGEISPALTEAINLAIEGNALINDRLDEITDDLNNVTGVDLYPIYNEIATVAQSGIRGATANDKAARAYRDEAFTRVDELRHDVLADGESYAAAIGILTTRVSDNAAAISNEATLRTNADAALANQISTVSSKADDNEAAILLENTTRANALEAVADQITELEADLGSANAAIIEERNARATALSAEATARNSQISTLNTTISAQITNEATTRATQDSALSTSISQLSARVDGAITQITNNNTASISRDNANITSINTLTANLNGTNATLAAVETQASAISTRLGSVEAKYVLSVNAGGVVGGMTLVANNSTSKIIFSADAIAFRNPTTNANEELMEFVGGEMRIKRARIGTANITNANMVDATLNGEKLIDMCTFGFGAYFGNLNGWRTGASSYTQIGGISVPLTTTVGNQKVVIQFQFVAARDGGDDDNLAISMRRNDGKYLQTFYDVQKHGGRRTYSYIFYDDAVSNYTTYTYTPVYYSIYDGNPYWYNVNLVAIVYKK